MFARRSSNWINMLALGRLLDALTLQAHEDRNLASKLTPAERREKKIKKLTGAASEGEAKPVSVYKVNCGTTPQQRFKIRANAEVGCLTRLLVLPIGQFQHREAEDIQHQLNACVVLQELHLSGCAVITDSIAVIVVEGGTKAQKKYAHIVQKRIKWIPEEEEDIDDDRLVALRSSTVLCIALPPKQEQSSLFTKSSAV